MYRANVNTLERKKATTQSKSGHVGLKVIKTATMILTLTASLETFQCFSC